MINLAAFKTPVFHIFSMLVSLIMLQGCGGARDEPFDPGSSTSSRGPAVTMTRLVSGDDPVTDVQTEGRIIKIRDEGIFETYWNEYTTEIHETIDFAAGQVLLVDLGAKNTCDRKLTLKQYAAYEGSVNSVIVVLDYTDSGASSNSSSTSSESSSSESSSSSDSSSSSSSNSSCSAVGTTHPFYFYYIKSRDEIIVEENVP